MISQTCTSVSGVLATSALLMSVGMGTSQANAASAAFNWVLKDGFGNIGNLLFASRMGSRFDVYPKRWLFRSGIVMQAAMALEILTATLPTLFLPLASTANFLKGMTWLAGSSSRATINLSFTRRLNLGDITAKQTGQNIATGLAGMGLGLLIAEQIGHGFEATAQAHLVLSIINIFSLKQALQHVVINTLNPERAAAVATSYVAAETIPTPADLANTIEWTVFATKTQQRQAASIVIGSSLSVASNHDALALRKIIAATPLERYRIAYTASDHVVHILLLEEADHSDIIKAYLHAAKLLQLKSERVRPTRDSSDDVARHHGGVDDIHTSYHYCEKHISDFNNVLLARGWNNHNLFVELKRNRIVAVLEQEITTATMK